METWVLVRFWVSIHTQSEFSEAAAVLEGDTGYLWLSGNILRLWWRGAPGTSGVRARDASKRPSVCGFTPTKNDLTPEASSAELRSAGMRPEERWWEGGTTLEVHVDSLFSTWECACECTHMGMEESASLLLRDCACAGSERRLSACPRVSSSAGVPPRGSLPRVLTLIYDSVSFPSQCLWHPGTWWNHQEMRVDSETIIIHFHSP